jgi:hypothetical protein
MDPTQFAQLWAALATHQYVAVAAVLIGMLVSLAKQGWLSAWVAEKVPAAARPVLAAVIGVVGSVALAVASGQDWHPALFQGLAAAMTAVFGHQMLVEGMLGGHELVSKAPWMKKPPANDVDAQSPPKAA